MVLYEASVQDRTCTIPVWSTVAEQWAINYCVQWAWLKSPYWGGTHIYTCLQTLVYKPYRAMRLWWVRTSQLGMHMHVLITYSRDSNILMALKMGADVAQLHQALVHVACGWGVDTATCCYKCSSQCAHTSYLLQASCKHQQVLQASASHEVCSHLYRHCFGHRLLLDLL